MSRRRSLVEAEDEMDRIGQAADAATERGAAPMSAEDMRYGAEQAMALAAASTSSREARRAAVTAAAYLLLLSEEVR